MQSFPDFDRDIEAIDLMARVFRSAGDDIPAAELAAIADRTLHADLAEILETMPGPIESHPTED